jgi:hypothetical protein
MADSGLPTIDYLSPIAPLPKWRWVKRIVPIAERIATIAATVCAALMLWAARLPVSDIPLLMLGFLAGALAAGLFVFCAAGEIFIHRSSGKPVRRKTILRLICAPVLLATTWALLIGAAPRYLIFRANKSAMDLWARQFVSGPNGVPIGAAPLASYLPMTFYSDPSVWEGTSAKVGSYDAYNIEPIPGGVKFLVNGSGFFRFGDGFAYSPVGPPPPTGAAAETFTSIGGGWSVRTYAEP